MLVYLSPSDQWSNIVADREHSEAYHCKQIAEAAKKYLEMNGYEVVIGDNSVFGYYTRRVKESNALKADLHVPIHTNAGGGEGTLMLCHSVSTNDKYVKGIYNAVASLTPTKDRGIQVRNDLYEISATNCVCAYLEVEFHDNVTTESWIDEHINEIGEAICQGICNADGKNMDLSPTILYRVQTGAFKKKENADKMSNELKEKGIENYVVYRNGYYKVQCGAFAKKENAEKMVKELSSLGYDSFITN